ncbi:unnamed protein product [Linum tenue]|uniref:Uncharacterized protein n=1 Tax=Linum tenue TaxID=586396 RepID=A0AAV0N9R5_9ROSI|nr:unnamed protein product [Linum tenue]
MNRLAGKVALITGGASGIGAATARLFAQNGAKVVIADVQSSLGDSVAKEASSNSQHPVSFVSCDVTKESDVESAVDAVVSAHGKLDIMYSNAGVTGDSSGHQILTVDAEELRRVLDINVVGGFLCAKHAARVMIPEKKGIRSIIIESAFFLTIRELLRLTDYFDKQGPFCSRPAW